MGVPEVLTNGNHKEIEAWQRKESVERTRERRNIAE
jgi:tRNA (guanine37-N1)-methyltransferase